MRYLAVLILALVCAAPAAAATGKTDPKIAALQRQVQTLQRQVRVLSSEIQAARSLANGANEAAAAAVTGTRDLTSSLLRNTQLDACGFALTYDTIYLMMYNDDIVLQALGAGRIYGPRSGLDDRGACAAAGVTRTPWVAHLRMASPTMEALLRPTTSVESTLYAPEHRSGCHARHTCPSDHATYRWRGMLCVKPTSDARNASFKRRVVYEGRTYYCKR